MKMYRTLRDMMTYSGAAGCDRPSRACRIDSGDLSCLNQDKTKFSKQSALAVKQYFRDNQHQSTGMSKFALA